MKIKVEIIKIPKTEEEKDTLKDEVKSVVKNKMNDGYVIGGMVCNGGMIMIVFTQEGEE